MRLIKNYVFDIGTKIPYSEWPEIVHRFLMENHLVSHRFLYYFEDLIINENKDEALLNCGCTKILKDCPSLGEIRYYNGKAHKRSDLLYLSNIDQQNSFPEEKILPLMKKIHRKYGLYESNLYFYDINFFGNQMCFSRDYSLATRISQEDNTPFDPTLYMNHQPYGSGITLHRDVCADNYLKLSVDVLHNGAVLDATPYCDFMQSLLPKIKVTTSLSIYLNEEEQQKIEETNRSAEPMLQQCREFLSQRLLYKYSQNLFSSNYSVAKPLKKLAKEYGYTYKLLWNGGVYSLEKRTARGNVLYIVVDCGSSHYNIGVQVTYQGVGFIHTIGRSNSTPTKQQEADAFLRSVISIISEFENTLLISLDKLYPETPSWFIPSIIG